MTGFRTKIAAFLGIFALAVVTSPVLAQEDDGGFADNLAGIVNALDIFFSMPLNEWNYEIVRLPNIRRNDIFGSIERGLGVRYDAGGFSVTLEPDFQTPEKLSCLRIEFETPRAFSDARLSTIEEDKIKPMMETLSRRFDATYALKSVNPGILFTLFITRLGDDGCRVYDQARHETRQGWLIG